MCAIPIYQLHSNRAGELFRILLNTGAENWGQNECSLGGLLSVDMNHDISKPMSYSIILVTFLKASDDFKS